jgi:hypothetical protein
MWNAPPGFRPTKSAASSPAKPLGVSRASSDSFHVTHKVPVGDSPSVRAKNVQASFYAFFKLVENRIFLALICVLWWAFLLFAALVLVCLQIGRKSFFSCLILIVGGFIHVLVLTSIWVRVISSLLIHVFLFGFWERWVWSEMGLTGRVMLFNFDRKWVRYERCFYVDSMFNFGFCLLIHGFLSGFWERWVCSWWSGLGMRLRGRGC